VATNDKRERPSVSNERILQDLKTLKENYTRLSATVGKLKDILQVQDNWHSRISKLIHKKVTIFLDGNIPMVGGELLWTDRYNIGVRVDGEDEIINKGHVIRIKRNGDS